MSTSPTKKEPTDYPEFGVRAETICRFFSPPLASSTFHDFVHKGKIVPLKCIRGFYKLNDSLRRLGLREMPEPPQEVLSRSAEDIIRLAFNAIEPEMFPVASWLLDVEVINGTDLHHAELIFAQHSEHVAELTDDRHKHAYLQGVLDAAAAMAADRLPITG